MAFLCGHTTCTTPQNPPNTPNPPAPPPPPPLHTCIHPHHPKTPPLAQGNDHFVEYLCRIGFQFERHFNFVCEGAAVVKTHLCGQHSGREGVWGGWGGVRTKVENGGGNGVEKVNLGVVTSHTKNTHIQYLPPQLHSQAHVQSTHADGQWVVPHLR